MVFFFLEKEIIFSDKRLGADNRRLGLFLPSLWLATFLAAILLLSSCTSEPPRFAPAVNEVTVTVDGRTITEQTTATTVRDLLEDLDIVVNSTDELSPPLFTPVTAGMAIEVTRVTESVETIEQTIPFSRKIVRNEAMGDDDPPQILQPGRTGLEQLTVRIVYRDGIEAERRVTQVTVIEESQDEIVMVGLGVAKADEADFSGLIAYINGNTPTLLRGSNSLPESLDVGGPLDKRVFALSPTGNLLLFTRAATVTTAFNSLWVIETVPGAEPRSLGVDNVLWAGWNPGRSSAQQIAFSTGEATSLPPGWEANNDLWLATIGSGPDAPFEPRQLVDSYPATYGWWGGRYAWSPDGEKIGYSFADEVGVIEITELASSSDEEDPAFVSRSSLVRFREYDTRADWVWVPTLTWSPDGRFLAFTAHSGDDTTALTFDTWIANTDSGHTGRLAADVGIWSHPLWASVPTDLGEIAFLKAVEPFASLQSGYALWLMDSDGSNSRQIFPPPGENTAFPRQAEFMAWQGDGTGAAFIFEDDLYLLNIDTNQLSLLADDDAIASNPSWAPYGAGLNAPAIDLPATPTPAEERQ